MWSWFRTESGRALALLVMVAIGASALGCSSMKATTEGRASDGSPIASRAAEAASVEPTAADFESGAPAAASSRDEGTRSATEHRLFDERSLEGWEEADFGGQGKAHVEEGVLVLPIGETLTGVRWMRSFPTMDYEIELEARREVGTDFFCGLTFPVEDACASLILGGWGGETCGISSFEDMDASENETTFYRAFEMNRWYAVKLRVTKTKIQAWIDGEQVIDVGTTGRRIGTRPEIDLCRPLGLATWQTTAALRNIRWRGVE